MIVILHAVNLAIGAAWPPKLKDSGWCWGVVEDPSGVDLDNPDLIWIVCEADEWAETKRGAPILYRGKGTGIESRNDAAAYIFREHPGHRTSFVAVEGRQATVGPRATARGWDYSTSTAGDFGTAIVEEYGDAKTGFRGTAIAGFNSTAEAGVGGVVQAGKMGTLSIWHVEGGHRRLVTGYTGKGEGKLLPNTPYKLDESGNFVPA